MDPKETLRQKFSSEYKKYYHVELFREQGFKRQRCANCGKFFWALVERKNCPDSTCQKYEFIGEKSPRKDYIETWKTIENFFVKNKHKSFKSYPVVCRWFPGLYYTVASIVAFQRSVSGKTVFEFPANPLIIPQQCLRFNDIPNVGVTGRHLTNFIMIGQHALYQEKEKKGYWKDTCIDLDYTLLTKALKIKPEEIAFLEDVWLGPNAFGYSLEYFVKGLELGNAVFTEFLGTPESYSQMENKVVDMGAGLERFAWLLNGTPTCYDVIFGPMMNELKSKINYDKEFFEKYAILSGSIELDTASDYKTAKKAVAKKMNVPVGILNEKTAPVEAIYALADHSRTILYSVTDGLLPSNVGGGYNLRVVLRRALGFISKHKIDADLYELCSKHAKYLKTMKPEIKESLGELKDILATEKERFESTKKRGRALIENILNKKIELGNNQMSELYESHGITPELVEEVSKELGVNVKLRSDFYSKLSSGHMKEKTKKEINIDLSGVENTELLFYSDKQIKDFDARVLRVMENKFVVLDKTAFYGRAGGQEPDTGFINNCRVYDVEKIGGVIVHLIENITFKEGEVVHCAIDWERREQLAVHHTTVHIINGAARKVLGNHVWQAGAHKTEKKAHIDITHHKQLTPQEIESIEELANTVVKKDYTIKKVVLSRQKAEELYGMRIYQGGAIPEKELRINIIQQNGKNFDVEACSGTHLDSTKSIGTIIITNSERIQDGIIRLSVVSGAAANAFMDEKRKTLSQAKKLLNASDETIIDACSELYEKWKNSKRINDKAKEDRALQIAKELEKKFVKDVLVEKISTDSRELLQKISKILSNDERTIILFGVGEKTLVFGSSGRKTGKNAGEIVKNACELLGGRGGGTQNLGQGVGIDSQKIDNVVKSLWKELLL